MASRVRTEITRELVDKEMVTAEEKNRCLATALYHISKSHTFLGSILQIMNMSYTHAIPTAGVMFNAEQKRWDIMINPYFFCRKLNNVKGDSKDIDMGDAARCAVLLHELYHVTHRHPMRVPFHKITASKRHLMNIAADLAINQFIKGLPNGCPKCPPIAEQKECENPDCPGRAMKLEFFPETDDQGKKTLMNERQTMEYYYEKLLAQLDESDEDGEGEGEGDGEGDKEGAGGKGGKKKGKDYQTLDEHMWDAAGEEKDMLDATEELIKRAMVKQRLSYDDLDAHIRELLQEIDTRRAQLDYRGMILSAIKRSASGHERKHSWTRKSRRFGNKAPGTKIGDLPKLSFYIDTSGSISIEEANTFLRIVDEFLKAGSRKCRMNLFHTKIYKQEEYKLGRKIKREEIESGGTELEECLRDIVKRDHDLSIFLTDGAYSDVDIAGWLPDGTPFPPCLFIISKDGDENHPLKRLGRTIKIPA